MTELINEFMKEYIKNTDELVDSSQEYYKLLNLLVNNIRKKLSDEYLVKGSCGQGRKSECPWICVFNKNITTGARNGLYYAILFTSDMSGFYLSLCLGMESFKELFKFDWELNLKKVAEYFRRNVENKIFTLSDIDLKVKSNTRGYGYEVSNVIAKYYDIDKNVDDLDKDIDVMKKIYDDICGSMDSMSYSEVISNILSYNNSDMLSINEANIQIEQSLLEEAGLNEAEIISLTEISVPIKKNQKFLEITNRKIQKNDYADLAKKQARVGLKGEQLVIAYEKEKMILNNRADLIDKILWVSEYDDSKGYDIESYDFDENGEEYKIYIEVKTTESSEKNIFFISTNEKKVMDILKDKYWIYRVCKIKKKPVFYKINGSEFYNLFDLKEYNYVVDLK